MKKTIERRGKTSSKTLFQKSEISSTTINLEPNSKISSYNVIKTKTETRINKRTSADADLRNCYGEGFENPIEKNSQGVEEIIKQISNYVEHNSNENAFIRTEKREESARNKTFPEGNTHDENIIEMNIPDKYMENLKWEESNLLQSLTEKQKRNTQNKKTKRNNVNKSSLNDKKHKKEFLPIIKTELNRNNKTQSEDFHLGVEKKKHNIPPSQETVPKEPPAKQTQPKKRKPSEIPLRKSRIEASRKSKAVSTYLHKSLEEVESTNSLDFYLKKPCSPIDEVSLCSELQITVNAVCSCDDLSDPDKGSSKTFPKPQESPIDFPLERCSKNFDIPTITSNMPEEHPEEKSSVKRTKMLDLDKVRTSSFTIIQTNPEVFDRLESLHKQNILTKEKINAVNSKKSKPLTPKQSVKSIKVKSIRNNTRLPTKRNKSNLRIKAKKSKKKLLEDVTALEESPINVKGPHIIILKKILEAESFAPERNENTFITETNENITAQVKNTEKSTKKARNAKENEEINIPTVIQDVEKSKKQKSFKNRSNSVSFRSRNRSITPKRSSEKSKKHFKSRKKEENVIPLEIEDDTNDKSSEKDEEEEVEESPKLDEITNDIENIKNEEDILQDDSFELILRGTALKFEKDIEEKLEDLSKKVKKQLKIDLKLQDTLEENAKRNQSCDSLYKRNKTPNAKENVIREEEPSGNKTDLNAKEDAKTVKTQNKVSNQKPKGVRKKQRSDAGDRAPFSPFSGSNLQQKPETKPRNGLTKPHKEEKEIFEEVSHKLKRPNSEPNSFNGFIWKRTDFPTFKGHKPSVSSMASSLKHLNTDDIDDFSFWEPVPQKVTCCWEMSLYHFQKPWTVLSRSVFRDNRLSNTPGLILQNIRNGGKLNLGQSSRSQKGRMNCVKENPFDIEPSIAQKNIDIRNWLAALNFPTSNSTPTNMISEGMSKSDAVVDAQNLNKSQVNPKRRKIFRNMKFPNETNTKDKNHYNGWMMNQMEGLKDLVRRKSGGFVISEEDMDVQHFTKLDLSLTSTPAEKTKMTELNENQKSSPQLTNPESATVMHLPLPDSHPSSECSLDKKFNSQTKNNSKISMEFNIWKYLFIFTLFIIIIHYYYYYCHFEIFAY